ncbi:hypothetical protein BDZ89DRAFT_1102596 [Hymenopellis radicata]|nr:hypothetical protein BDZ89DRAFT_1102596 [Hymenopellis radicata]
MKIHQERKSRQPRRKPWSRERLIHERAIALGLAIDTSTMEPTPDTLSFYVIYMSAHIDPRSVASYLSGICNKLEPYFPEVRANRGTLLVKRSLSGCHKRYGRAVKRKLPLARSLILTTIASIHPNSSHDDLLFAAMLCTGFCALMRLGELSVPDNVNIRDLRKCSRRSTVTLFHDGYEFDLPYHKADRFFEGNKIRILRRGELNPLPIFRQYISSRDKISRLNPFLWITVRNEIPTRAWFMKRLRRIEPDTQFAGQSMRAGGATAMAEDGFAPHLIQAAGRWASASGNRL